jgi:hypothetical protein
VKDEGRCLARHTAAYGMRSSYRAAVPMYSSTSTSPKFSGPSLQSRIALGPVFRLTRRLTACTERIPTCDALLIGAHGTCLSTLLKAAISAAGRKDTAAQPTSQEITVFIGLIPSPTFSPEPLLLNSRLPETYNYQHNATFHDRYLLLDILASVNPGKAGICPWFVCEWLRKHELVIS